MEVFRIIKNLLKIKKEMGKFNWKPEKHFQILKVALKTYLIELFLYIKPYKKIGLCDFENSTQF